MLPSQRIDHLYQSSYLIAIGVPMDEFDEMSDEDLCIVSQLTDLHQSGVGCDEILRRLKALFGAETHEREPEPTTSAAL